MGSQKRPSAAEKRSRIRASHRSPSRVKRLKSPSRKSQAGRKQALSCSQVRKLARLYLFTTLSWQEILILVARSGSGKVKKRILQMRLKEWLGDGYERLKQWDKALKKNRMLQIHTCNEIRLARREQRNDTRAKASTVESETIKSFSQNRAPFETENLPTSDPSPIQDLNAKKPLAVETELPHLAEPGQIAESPISTQRTHSNELTTLEFECFADENLLKAEFPIHTGDHRQRSPVPEPSLNFNWKNELSHTPFSNSLGHSEPLFPGLLDMSLPDYSFEDSLKEGEQPPLDSKSATQNMSVHALQSESVGLQCQTQQSKCVNGFEISLTTLPEDFDSSSSLTALDSEDFQPLNSIISDHSGPPPAVPRPIQIKRDSQESDVSGLIDRLSRYSLSEKTYIKDLLNRFSTSTSSSGAMSRRSFASLSMLSASEVRESVDLDATVKNPITVGQPEMPGDFISSKINNFSHHLLCTKEDLQTFELEYCQECFKLQYLSGEPKFNVPIAIMKRKRGHKIDPDLLLWGWSWIDRFGNSSLHIAASLEAPCEVIIDIIEKGVSVHRTNSGGQTFLHILKLSNWTIDGMLRLREILQRHGFNFYHLDVRGRTFLESIESDGVHPLDFARCWLEIFLENLSKKAHIVSLDQIKGVFRDHGGSQDQWLIFKGDRGLLTSCSIYFKVKNKDFIDMDLFSLEFLGYDPSGQPNIRPKPRISLKMQFYQDPSGRNFLHIAVERLRLLNSRRYPDDGVKISCAVIQCLLDLEVDVNKQDASGETALMTHIRSPSFHKDVLKKLLVSGAKPNLRNNLGDTALHISVTLGNITATELLLAHKANVHARNNMGEGVLASAEFRRPRSDKFLFTRIYACMGLVIDAGGVARPDSILEWSLPTTVQQANHDNFSFCLVDVPLTTEQRQDVNNI